MIIAWNPSVSTASALHVGHHNMDMPVGRFSSQMLWMRASFMIAVCLLLPATTNMEEAFVQSSSSSSSLSSLSQLEQTKFTQLVSDLHVANSNLQHSSSMSAIVSGARRLLGSGGNSFSGTSSITNGLSTTNSNSIQCPSFDENSACPCYKFEDGKYTKICILSS